MAHGSGLAKWKLYRHMEAHIQTAAGEAARRLMCGSWCVCVCVCVCRRARVTSVPAVLGAAGLACPTDLQIPSPLCSTQRAVVFFKMHMCYTSQHTHWGTRTGTRHTPRRPTAPSVKPFQFELGQVEQHLAFCPLLEGFRSNLRNMINLMKLDLVLWKQFDLIRSFDLGLGIFDEVTARLTLCLGCLELRVLKSRPLTNGLISLFH